MTNYRQILDEAYSSAEQVQIVDETFTFSNEIKGYIETIVDKAENNKAVLAVTITLIAHKIVVPEDDIRYHQKDIGNFSGRTIDSKFITPFIKEKNFPAMVESGWLTRSLEQKVPYDLNYPGAIKPTSLKNAFLQLINEVQVNGVDAKSILTYFFVLLIRQRDSYNIDLAKPHSLSISNIIEVLHQHFDYPYHGHGASRLPTLAIYAAYECMMKEVSRFHDKQLCPLESHTSADSKSGQIGDIQINDINGEAFEGVEIKHNIEITKDMVEHAYTKFMSQHTNRYYLLTTADMSKADWIPIEEEIKSIERKHGCQVIVNGVYTSLKYYLRLLSDPSDFIECYVNLMKNDENVKYPQKATWNEIISKLNL